MNGYHTGMGISVTFKEEKEMYKLKTPEELKRIFISNMHYYMSALDVYVSEIEENTDIPAQTIYNYINGKSLPNLYKAYILADYFECTIDDLFREKEK